MKFMRHYANFVGALYLSIMIGDLFGHAYMPAAVFAALVMTWAVRENVE